MMTQNFQVDFKAEIKLDYRGDIREYINESKLSDRPLKRKYESSMVEGGYSLSSCRTKNSQITAQKTKVS